MLFLTATMHLNHSTARNLMQYGLDSLYFPFFTRYKVHANDEYFLDQYSDVQVLRILYQRLAQVTFTPLLRAFSKESPSIHTSESITPFSEASAYTAS